MSEQSVSAARLLDPSQPYALTISTPRPPPTTPMVPARVPTAWAAVQARMQRPKAGVANDDYPLNRGPLNIPDGAIVGANSSIYESETNLEIVRPVRPLGGVTSERLVFVNGINTPPQSFISNLRALAASANGAAVYGVYNGTRGFKRDWVKSYKDHILAESNPAIVTLANIIERSLLNRRPLHIVAHSQGAAVAAQALRVARARASRTLSRPKVYEALQDIRVETHGAAGSRFIDGPSYLHYINSEDPVPHGMGLARSINFSGLHYPGRDATFRFFSHVEARVFDKAKGAFANLFEHWDNCVHSMNIYAAQRKRFTEAQRHGNLPAPAAEIWARVRWAPLRLVMEVLSLPITLRHWFRR